MQKIKFPKTPHLPYSESVSADDIVNPVLPDTRIVVTEKMDGQIICMTRHFIHARSVEDLPRAEYNNNIKRIWGEIRHAIPEGVYLYGEDVTIKHSIYYTHLPHHFLLFAVVENERVMSWTTTDGWARHLGIGVVPVLYRGVFDQALIHKAWKPLCGDVSEGYVVRGDGNFPFATWGKYASKFVRAGHVQGDHWTNPPYIYNRLNKPQE